MLRIGQAVEDGGGFFLEDLLPFGGEEAFDDFVAALVVSVGGRAVVHVAIRKGGKEGVWERGGGFDAQAHFGEHFDGSAHEGEIANAKALNFRSDGVPGVAVDVFVAGECREFVLNGAEPLHRVDVGEVFLQEISVEGVHFFDLGIPHAPRLFVGPGVR